MSSLSKIEQKAFAFAKEHHKEVIHPSLEFYAAGYLKREKEQNLKDLETLKLEFINKIRSRINDLKPSSEDNDIASEIIVNQIKLLRNTEDFLNNIVLF